MKKLLTIFGLFFFSVNFAAAFSIEDVVDFNFNGFKIADFSVTGEKDEFQKMVVQNLSGQTFPSISHISISYKSFGEMVTRRFLETPYTEPIEHYGYATICNNGNPETNGGIVCHYSADLDLPPEITELILKRENGIKIFHAQQIKEEVLFFNPTTSLWEDLTEAKKRQKTGNSQSGDSGTNYTEENSSSGNSKSQNSEDPQSKNSPANSAEENSSSEISENSKSKNPATENSKMENSPEENLNEPVLNLNLNLDLENAPKNSSENSAVKNKSEEIIFADAEKHWAKEYIYELVEVGAVDGKTAEVFAPEDFISRAEITKIALLGFGFTIPEEVPQKPFWDVEITDWFAKFVAMAKRAGVVNGFVGNIFKPEKSVKRIDALKIILAASDLNIVGGKMDFPDLTPGDWYEKYVAFAQSNDIIHGVRGEFRPESFITRAEAAKIVVETLRKSQK